MVKGLHKQGKMAWVTVSVLMHLLFAPSHTLANPVEKGASLADSINALAEDPDFITASLLIVEPGNKVYSIYGHAAIRLQNPANQLDYCFTFEMLLGTFDQLKFLFSTAKSGYNAFPTEQFIAQYQKENRGITEYVLNLNPQQEQELWRRLDEELVRGPVWNYSFLTTNCSSMCVYAIESSLQGEHIEYHNLHPALTGTYTDLLEFISRNAPWSELFWKIRMGKKGSENGELNDKLAPEMLPDAWMKATFVDSLGNSRPVLAGAPVTLLPWSGKPQQPPLLTPVRTLLLLTLILVIYFLFHYLKKVRL